MNLHLYEGELIRKRLIRWLELSCSEKKLKFENYFELILIAFLRAEKKDADVFFSLTMFSAIITKNKAIALLNSITVFNSSTYSNKNFAKKQSFNNFSCRYFIVVAKICRKAASEMHREETSIINMRD